MVNRLSFLSPIANAFRIAWVSNSAFASFGTVMTSLVITPLLKALLLISFLTAAEVPSGVELRDAAYGSILISFGLAIMNGAVAEGAKDRQIGVIQEVVGHTLWNPVFWTGKILVPMLLGIPPATLSALAVYLGLGAGDVGQLWRVLWLIPISALVGSLIGIAATISSFGLADPYLISNIANTGLLITAGVVLPLSLYPGWLAALAQLLPFTAAIEAVRTAGPMWPLILRELLVAFGWFGVGVLLSRRVLAAIRSGRRTEEVL